MRRFRHARRLGVLSILIVGSAIALAVPALTTTASAASGAVARPRPVLHEASHGVKPNATGELDCNGLSPIQRSVKPGLACTDPRGSDEGRFLDNGHYIGHDEPSMRFLSTRRGSGNDFRITENLPRDPKALPTVKTPGKDVAKVSGRCVWEFGNMNNGRSFGGVRQYGKVGPGTIGAFVGPIRPQASC
jgi:hypothetical protein